MATFNLIRVSLGQISMYLSLDHCILILYTYTFNHQFIFIFVNINCSCINFFINFIPIIHMHTRGYEKLNSNKIYHRTSIL